MYNFSSLTERIRALNFSPTEIVQLKSYAEVRKFFTSAVKDNPDMVEKCIKFYGDGVKNHQFDFYSISNIAFLCVKVCNDNCISPIEIFEEENRNKGLGSKLILYVQKKYKYLTLNVSKTNARAIHVYEKYGFKRIGEDEKHYHMRWEK